MVLDRDNRLKKADASFLLAQKYYRQTIKNNIWNHFPFWHSKKHKTQLLDTARQHLNIASKNYQLINENKKNVQVLKFKSTIEKELNHPDYFHTMVLLGDYYTNNRKQSIAYYCDAIFDILDNRPNQINHQLIELSLKIIDKYHNLLSFHQLKKIYQFLIKHYFNTENYPDALQICEQFSDYLISQKITNSLSHKIFYWTILAVLSQKEYELAKKKFKCYCKFSDSFKNSTFSKFIGNILVSIKNNNISEFSKYFAEYYENYHMEYFEIKILVDLFLP